MFQFYKMSADLLLNSKLNTSILNFIFINQGQHMIDQTLIKCCLCNQQFDQNNLPRRMPSCHSSCTNCLVNLIQQKAKDVQCGFCSNKQRFIHDHIDKIPRNIRILPKLRNLFNSTKQNSVNTTQNFISTKTQSNQSNSGKVQSNSAKSLRDDIKICETHNKQMQLICIRDFTRLCPLCAVFGPHKQHQLKTLIQTDKIISQTKQQFNLIVTKKKQTQLILKNLDFKKILQSKILTSLHLISDQIQQKFHQLRQALKDAEKNAFDDLNKRVKEVREYINILAKEESDFQTFYQNWLAKISQALNLSTNSDVTKEEEVMIMFSGPVNQVKQGHFYVSQTQQFNHQKKKRILKAPQQLNLSFQQGLLKDIYNNVTIKFNVQNIKNSPDLLLYQDSRIKYESSQSLKSIQNQSTICTMIQKRPTGQQLMVHKKPITVQFSNSQNFLVSKQTITAVIPTKSSPSKLTKINSQHELYSRSTKQISKKVQSNQELYSSQKVVEMFCNDGGLDTLDISRFGLNSEEILLILQYCKDRKRIKCLKSTHNLLDNQGFSKVLSHLKFVTNFNCAKNNITEDALAILIKNRHKVPTLRILNLSQNKVNERKAKVYIEELKKVGIIVTL